MASRVPSNAWYSVDFSMTNYSKAIFDELWNTFFKQLMTNLSVRQGDLVTAAMSSFWKSVMLRTCECKMMGDSYFATAPSHWRPGWVCWKWIFLLWPGSKSLFKYSSHCCQLDFPLCLLGPPNSIFFKEPKLNDDGIIFVPVQFLWEANWYKLSSWTHLI